MGKLANMLVKGDDNNFYRDPVLQHEGDWLIDFNEDGPDEMIVQARLRKKGEPRSEPQPLVDPKEFIATYSLPIASLKYMGKSRHPHLLGKKVVVAVAYRITWAANARMPVKHMIGNSGMTSVLRPEGSEAWLFASEEDKAEWRQVLAEQQRQYEERTRPEREAALQRFQKAQTQSEPRPKPMPRPDPAFDAFSQQVIAAGLIPINHGGGHWQIKGGKFLVNYYPSRGTVYIAGTHGGRHGNVKKAIEAANKLPEKIAKNQQSERPNRHYAKRLRRQKWHKQGGICHWCHKPMVWGHKRASEDEKQEFASIDHVIPIARNGNNGDDNIVLAHVRCNSDRGCDMPEFFRNNPDDEDFGLDETTTSGEHSRLEGEPSGRGTTGDVCPEHVEGEHVEVEGEAGAAEKGTVPSGDSEDGGWYSNAGDRDNGECADVDERACDDGHEHMV